MMVAAVTAPACEKGAAGDTLCLDTLGADSTKVAQLFERQTVFARDPGVTEQAMQRAEERGSSHSSRIVTPLRLGPRLRFRLCGVVVDIGRSGWIRRRFRLDRAV